MVVGAAVAVVDASDVLEGPSLDPSDVPDTTAELEDSSTALEGLAVVVTSAEDSVSVAVGSLDDWDVIPPMMLVKSSIEGSAVELAASLVGSLAVAVGLTDVVDSVAVCSAELLDSAVFVSAGRREERSPKREVICPAIPPIPLATLELSADDSDVVVASLLVSEAVSVADGSDVVVGRRVGRSTDSLKIPRRVVVSAASVESVTSLEAVSLAVVEASVVSTAVELAASVAVGRSPLTIETIPPKRSVDEADSVLEDASVVVVSAAVVDSVEEESAEGKDAMPRVGDAEALVEVSVAESVKDASESVAVGRSVDASLVVVGLPAIPLLVAVVVTLAASSTDRVVAGAEPTAAVALATRVPLTVPLTVSFAAAVRRNNAKESAPIPFTTSKDRGRQGKKVDSPKISSMVLPTWRFPNPLALFLPVSPTLFTT